MLTKRYLEYKKNLMRNNTEFTGLIPVVQNMEYYVKIASGAI